jgi:small ligand-binding sensory domain FIST
VWSSFVSRRINLELAVEEAVEKALASQPPGWQPELGVVFVSSAYASEYGALLRLLRARVPSLQRIIGSSVSFEGVQSVSHVCVRRMGQPCPDAGGATLAPRDTQPHT